MGIKTSLLLNSRLYELYHLLVTQHTFVRCLVCIKSLKCGVKQIDVVLRELRGTVPGMQ